MNQLKATCCETKVIHRLEYANLTLNHTNMGFRDPEKDTFRKYYGKRRKFWKPAFSPFPTISFILQIANMCNSQTYFDVCKML